MTPLVLIMSALAFLVGFLDDCVCSQGLFCVGSQFDLQMNK